MKIDLFRRQELFRPGAERPIKAPRFSIGSLTRGFSALANTNYRLFATGQLVSLTGSWAQRTAQDWLVIQLTQSPFALGLVTACQFLPVLLLSLFGGVLTDRWPKHKLLLVTQTASLIQAAVFGLLVATNAIEIWHIYILAAIQGIITAVDNPGRQAFVPELVGKEQLGNAIALNSTVFNASRIVGPALAGILIANVGIAPALFANAASYVVVIACLLLMNLGAMFSVPAPVIGNFGQRLLEGVRYVWRTPEVLFVMMLMAAIGTFGYNFSVILPLVAGFVLKTGPDGLGALSAFVGVGALTAALVAAYSRAVTPRRLLIGATVFSSLLIGVALSTNFAFTAITLVALGFAAITFSTTANTLLQTTVPDELRGRVMSIYILLFVGSTPVGGFLIGSLSSAIGVPWTLTTCATLCLLGVAGSFIFHRRHSPQTA